MFFSLAIILLGGLGAGALFKKLRLPAIIGMLLVGVLAGPCVLNLFDESILSISADLRKTALVIILMKAGLSLDLGDLRRVGRPAVMMACVPAACEIAGYVLTAPLFLGISRAEAAVMGAVLAAVSPAVVVPRMVKLMEEGRGTDKSIPQLILAGASCDDIFVIVLFTSFLGMAQGEGIKAADLLEPQSVRIPLTPPLKRRASSETGSRLFLYARGMFLAKRALKNHFRKRCPLHFLFRSAIIQFGNEVLPWCLRQNRFFG